MKTMTATWSQQPRPIGEDATPNARLLGTIEIDGVPFHAEFIQVRRNRKTGEQEPVQEHFTNWEALCRSDDYGPFRTITCNRRHYAVLITPFCD